LGSWRGQGGLTRIAVDADKSRELIEKNRHAAALQAASDRERHAAGRASVGQRFAAAVKRLLRG
jgi:hypothetical protein